MTHFTHTLKGFCNADDDDDVDGTDELEEEGGVEAKVEDSFWLCGIEELNASGSIDEQVEEEETEAEEEAEEELEEEEEEEEEEADAGVSNAGDSNVELGVGGGLDEEEFGDEARDWASIDCCFFAFSLLLKSQPPQIHSPSTTTPCVSLAGYFLFSFSIRLPSQ
jgi:hypothetical protein